jgi:hypothetical protein
VIKEQYFVGCILVFSGANNPLARAIINFWHVGIKLSNLVGIVLSFMHVLVVCIFLCCFQPDNIESFSSFISLKYLCCKVFHPI